MIIKLSIPNLTPSAQFFDQLRIGEAFGFKVASLIGHRLRRERVRQPMQKVFTLSIQNFLGERE